MKGIIKIYIESEDELHRIMDRMWGKEITVNVTQKTPPQPVKEPKIKACEQTLPESCPDDPCKEETIPEYGSGARRAIEKRTCAYKHCSNNFFTKTDQRFCSRECSGKDRRDRNQDAKLAKIRGANPVRRGRPRINRNIDIA